MQAENPPPFGRVVPVAVGVALGASDNPINNQTMEGLLAFATERVFVTDRNTHQTTPYEPREFGRMLDANLISTDDWYSVQLQPYDDVVLSCSAECHEEGFEDWLQELYDGVHGVTWSDKVAFGYAHATSHMLYILSVGMEEEEMELLDGHWTPWTNS
jgi:hypothetical protein